MKFLGRALRALREAAGEGPARVQYFNVACALGHRLRGERTEGYQALRCPTCGAGVFVLPRSPLPEPPVPAGLARAPARRRPGAVGADGGLDDGPIELKEAASLGAEAGDVPDFSGPAGEAEIVWEDVPSSDRGSFEADIDLAIEEEIAADRARPLVAPGRRVRRGASREKDQGAAAPASRERDGAEAPQSSKASRAGADLSQDEAASSRGGRRSADGTIVVDERARAGRRVRLAPLFLAVALVVAAAVGWRAWRQRRQEYPIIAERARTEGIPALDRGDFDRAHQLLSAGKAAVNALGGAVEGAEDVRHAADEAAIFVGLAPDSLEEMLDEAARLAPESWAARFKTLYKGRAYLFDSWITAAPENEGGPGRYELAYVVLPAGASGRFGDGGLGRPERFAAIDLEGFRLFELARPAVGNRVIFGARLADFRFDDDSNRWTIALVPDSGVFMTHARALESLGWPRPGADLPPLNDEGPP